jgi:hypothetical protein
VVKMETDGNGMIVWRKGQMDVNGTTWVQLSEAEEFIAELEVKLDKAVRRFMHSDHPEDITVGMYELDQ